MTIANAENPGFFTRSSETKSQVLNQAFHKHPQGLFVSQGLDRINSRRATRGQIASQQRDA
ncbi:MAG TPA: hypothetical protein VLR92_11340, partial [Blastocatellia bacterium]|nr:hypothetical protein [Blastocatellia bacterium]